MANLSDQLPLLSNAFGISYFLLWSISFWPQFLKNWRNRSTRGTTVDFPFLNTLGFACYTIYTWCMLWSDTTRELYKARHGGLEPAVSVWDWGFAVHGTIACVAVLSQFWMSWWNIESIPSAKRPRPLIMGIFCGGIVAVVVVYLGVLLLGAPSSSDYRQQARSLSFLDVIYALSFVKVIVTVVKYAPQAWYNYQNKSTKGWSIVQILLDFCGGVLSLAELSGDAYLIGNWGAVMGNAPKFLLGAVSIGYDCIFIWQHYVLYPEHRRQPVEDGDRRLD